LLLTFVLLVPSASAGSPGVTGSPTASFQLPSLLPSIHLAPSFWGADTRIYYPANSTLATAYNNSGLEFVRWPGGAVADQYNLTQNRIYQDGGHYDTPPTDIQQFVHWCRAVGCHAIVQLPGEIDSPSTAAYEVAYLERTIGFTPSYYELGNEPALWNHFGVPWASWNGTQHTNASPAEYAELVHTYVAAIHAVDPSAHILGLPGVGTGGYNEATWISATVRLNGPNLSGVAIHVYPAGPGPQGVATLSQFYSSLAGGGSLAKRIPLDRAAIQRACPGCTNAIPVLVSEMGSGNGGQAFDAFMKSYDDVPYIATELLQGMQANVTNIDLFALEGTYPGSIIGPSSAPTPVGIFYSTFASALGGGVLSVTHAPSIPGLALAVLTGRVPGTFELLVVNTNLTAEQTLTLTGSGFPVGPANLRVWNRSLGMPTITLYPGRAPTTLTVAADGILLLTVTPGITPIGPGPASVRGLPGGDVPALDQAQLSGSFSPPALAVVGLGSTLLGMAQRAF
jgi:hypothetical protein